MAAAPGQSQCAVSLGPAGLVAIRHAIEHGAARLVRRARIFHRHHTLALADEHARAHDDRRLVADDDARMRRGQAGARAVGPDDRIACEDAAPAVFAGDIDPLAGSGLRPRRPGIKRRCRGHQNREHQRPMGGHAALRWLNRHHDPSSTVTGFRFKSSRPCKPAPVIVSNYLYYSVS